MKKRIFEPRKKSPVINHWVWTKSKGLQAVTLKGCKFKSFYTLPELLRIERPIEITKGYHLYRIICPR